MYGTYQDTCHPTSGQCDCRPGFIGQQCDRCISTSSTFPYCQGKNNKDSLIYRNIVQSAAGMDLSEIRRFWSAQLPTYLPKKWIAFDKMLGILNWVGFLASPDSAQRNAFQIINDYFIFWKKSAVRINSESLLNKMKFFELELPV